MATSLGVSIFNNPSNNDEYVIKDKNKINIGRFFIKGLDIENRKCDIKLNFYKREDEELLEDTLEIMLKVLFKDGKINKLNILVSEDMPLTKFLEKGFVLEGIQGENIYSKGEYYSELYLGITRADYSNGSRISLATIKGERVDIRLLTPENSKELLQYYIKNKEHLRPFEPSRDNGFYTLKTQRELLSESYRMFLNGTTVDFGLFLDNKLIGKLKLSNIVQGIFKSGILGYSIDKEYEGQGYMTEGVSLVLDYAFEEMELHRVEASALIENKKSIRLLESCGFNRLGINEKYLFINGKWRDHITYYIIKR